MRRILSISKQSLIEFYNDNCMSNGAAVAYYTIFAMPPLLAVVFMIATTFTSQEQIELTMNRQFGLPLTQEAESRRQAQSRLEEIAGRTRVRTEGNTLSQATGIALLLISATAVLAQLQYALNDAWGIEPDPAQGGLKNFVLKRVLSLGMIIVMGLLLLVSLVLSIMIEELIRLLDVPSGTVLQVLIRLLNDLASLAVATALFTVAFKILPDAWSSWSDVWKGGLMTGILFVIGKSVISWYLRFSNVGFTWGGAAASLVAILVWVYYSSLIMLLGAEFTQVWARRYGKGIEPVAGAVRTVAEKRLVRESGEEVEQRTEKSNEPQPESPD